MIINLLNIVNNAYDRSLKAYLRPQNPNTKELVDGKWVQFTPNRKYYAESPEVITAYNMLKMGRQAEIRPDLLVKAMELAVKGGPVLHDPSKSYDNVDKQFRGPVHPTSSAIGRMSYNPKTQRVTFAFRNRKGGLGRTYSGLMDNQQIFRWISSSSIGKYFNQRLKGKM